MEHEAHHVDPHDSYGKIVGIQAAILAVLLSVFTIFAHRAHTDTIIFGNEATDMWSHYQAKRIRAYQLDMNAGLVKLLAPNSTEASNTIKEYADQGKKYEGELEEIKTEAQAKVKAEELAHHRASFYDLAEGLLEVALILSSLYFISRKRLFPMLGLFFGLGGIVVGILGFFLK